MARIFNSTFNDENSLQVDLDDLLQNYSATMRRILKHIGVENSLPDYYSIIGALTFFDIKVSRLYRWNMASQNHIDHSRPKYQIELLDILKGNKEILKAYGPILEMFQGHNSKNRKSFSDT